jgi:hypothetical protein
MKDIKKIQEFFSKPLEEGKQLDQVDFAKVVKAVEQTGHPVTVLLVPKFNEIEVLTGTDAPDDMLRDLSNAVDSLGYGRNDIIIAGDSSNLSRREYSDIRRVNGGAKDYYEEAIAEDDSYARVSKPRFVKDKNNPNFLNVYIDYDLGPGGSSIALGKETMTGQIRRATAIKAKELAFDVARDLKTKYNLEDIDVQDLENGKIHIFAVSDDFIDMDPNMLSEVKEETGVDMVKKRLDALGVKYEMSKTDKVRPFKVIYKPINKSDKFYDEFEDIVDLFNLKGFVKTSMDEAKFRSGLLSGKDFINAKLSKYPKAVSKINQLIDMIGEDKFTIEMAEWIFDFFNNAHFESPMNEATKDEETTFHKKLDKLVHDIFGKRKGELEEVTLKKGDIVNFADGKKFYIIGPKGDGYEFTTDNNQRSFQLKKWFDMMISKGEATLESVKEAKMPEPRKDEYYFLVRNSDAKDVWKMADYEFGNDIDRGRIEVLFQKNKYVIKDFELAKRFYQYLRDRGVKFFDQNFASESVEVTESYVPSNIAEFAKRRGVSSLVRKVAGWAEKVGARITGGTAIGKGYNTLILDMGYQTADIRIDVEDETIELYDEPIYSFNDFKRVFMEEESRKQAEHDEETLRREQGLEEVVSKVISKIKEDRPGLWANIHAQRERGEKPARKGSKDYKAAVKAGKEINKKK